MRKAIRGDEHCGAAWKQPNVDEADYVGIVTEVEEEIMPGFLFICVGTYGNEDEGANCVRDVDPSVTGGTG